MGAVKDERYNAKYLELMKNLKEFPDLWNSKKNSKQSYKIRRKWLTIVANRMRCTKAEVNRIKDIMLAKYMNERCKEKKAESKGKKFNSRFFPYEMMKLIKWSEIKNSSNSTKKTEENISDSHVTDIPDSHKSLQGNSKAFATTTVPNLTVSTRRTCKSKLEGLEEIISISKKPEEDSDCHVMDIPVSHKPFQGHLKAVATMRVPDPTVSSTRNHESKLEGLKEIKTEEDGDSYRTVSYKHLLGNLETTSKVTIPDSTVSSTRSCEVVSKNVTEQFVQTDEYSIYGQHVGNKLRNYSKKTRAMLEHHINNLLFGADMGEFDRPSVAFASSFNTLVPSSHGSH